ncbi:MAG: AAA family ATPase [Haliscomenobacter sp.]|uniref:AAA family ATPase n=1 Tax=Haliscomenobacter sp. TaxID=2717303 RepID=UPI0029BCC802|nr:AAA family ATPase [Haliscomenobacter sp.]MDX2068795.1 AAA family ATPase [Haliscomenobacter sp.]
MSNGPSFAITSFHIEDFRGIKNASVEGIPADTKWIFLTGKNGGGKTSVLQALLVGLESKWDGDTPLESGEFIVNIHAEYKDGSTLNIGEVGENKPIQSWPRSYHSKGMVLISRTDNPYLLFIKPVVAYGANRTQIYTGSIANEKNIRSRSLFGRDTTLLNIESEYKNWMYRSSSQELISKDFRLAENLKSRANGLKKLLLRLMPNLEDIEVDVIEDKVVYFEKDDVGNRIIKPKTFEQLASGNRSIIAMVGDMVIRLLDGQPNISDPSDLEGIVLIDELDIHLHPTWQKALPGLLSEIFPKIQFISSTHSPIPLLGAPKESVVLKVHQSSEEGITVEKLDIDLTRLLPNSLLTSPIFDFEEMIPSANTSLSDLHTEDSFQEAMANEEIKERLKKIAQSLK